MRTGRRFTMAGIGAILLLRLATPAVAAKAPEPPKPPVATPPGAPAPSDALPPRPPKTPHLDKGNPTYTLESGSTNVGDLYLLKESVVIRGVQKGDLMTMGRELEVTGTVTGDTVAIVGSAELGGKMGDSVRSIAQSTHVTGDIDGDLVAVGEKIVIEKSAHITGDVSAKGAAIEINGQVDGDVDATGGEVHLLGKVGGSATLKGDVVEVDPKAKVAGDLNYTSRDRIEAPDKAVVHGEVNYTPEQHTAHVSRGGVAKWFVWTATAILIGLVCLAMFKRTAPDIIAAVRNDGLRSAGIGFITAIVLPVALLISCILIITIPAVALAFIAYGILLYLSQVPVAAFVGDWVLRRLGREASPFAALAVGVPILYLVFKIPVIGMLALFATVFTGFGAIVVTIWTVRQARRPQGPPQMPMPPAVPVSA
jgi:cytoskeletal protein CcmA (bactofilin family)